ncbi:DNA-binding response regulator [Roseburia sp. OM04-10BH]|jgi:DNA-binding response OmpR family regulator|uniref:response regulator transcription factor n=1 Tax=unclassified Roseburia TaxID=2637578 RepID=UPI000E4C970B|nr:MULTISPECIES: response regulator transcription factor [unclassified Roseburia]RGI44826.1 DNA-binding response regulator [Roseburia sp. OM04-10BH]RHV41690.1 DNA-binding response regulator [Roseburia sp. OM04-15AA]RHV58654.1 DNA-binding response regulator [Roseburia sp. OM04-10AA]HBM01715.1 DNA-binding response regulator [Roseburia sp.]
MTHVLLVDDDTSIVSNLRTFLNQEGFQVTSANNQKETIDLLDSGQYHFDLALLDVSLPDGSGFSLCSAIKANSDIPVIFLTASDDEYSVVAGLDLGADDYISKPFRPRELISRMNSVLRRYHRGSQPLEYHELKADTVRGLVYKNNVELTLSALEYRLLLLFLSNQGIVLTRSRLLDELWDMAGEFVNDNTLTVYIKRLREKIEADPAHPEYIKTIRGLGYKLGD